MASTSKVLFSLDSRKASNHNKQAALEMMDHDSM